MKKNSSNIQSGRTMVVVGEATNYTYKDHRAMKPILVECPDHPKYSMNNSFQYADTVKVSKNKKLEYFVPNNISILLSNSQSALKLAKKMYYEELPKHIEIIDDKVTERLWDNCTFVSDYIEKIQTAIVFSYTALEAFANISIPDDYIYLSKMNSKGIKEQFDREAIERWLSLKDKLNLVLPGIYKSKQINKERIWSQFLFLENYRNQIIHQKAIESTSFYYDYFKPNIFKVLEVSEKIICFFHDSNDIKSNDGANVNLMWPWLNGAMTVPILKTPEPILGWTVIHSAQLDEYLANNPHNKQG